MLLLMEDPYVAPERIMPSNGSQPTVERVGANSWPRRVLRWWEKGLITLVVTAVAAALVYLAIGRNGDLVVWVSKETVIYPSEQTANLALPLAFAQKPVERLAFVEVEISNAGKAPIGDQKDPWTLTMRGPDNSTLVALGGTQASDPRVVVNPAPSPSPNILSIVVGVLEPREYLTIRAMIANAPSGVQQLEFDTSLKGLPRPLRTNGGLTAQAGRRLVIVLWPVFFILLVAEAIRDRKDPERAPGLLRQVADWRLRLLGRVPLAILLSGMSAAFLSYGIGWAAVTLWRAGILS
jgi:hypothetical protein